MTEAEFLRILPLNLNRLSNIAIKPLLKNLIFDYATLYTLSHPSVLQILMILKPTDEEYAKFLEFLSDKNYDYTTESDDQLEELIKTAKAGKIL